MFAIGFFVFNKINIFGKKAPKLTFNEKREYTEFQNKKVEDITKFQ